MKKESKASKIAGGFNDSLDIEKLASVASQMSAPSTPSVPTAKIVVEEDEKKDRRFTIILPHDLYMKMVVKTKTKGISFTKYIHQLMQSDLD
jgi:predicted DNA binding CopG/RHH family protein